MDGWQIWKRVWYGVNRKKHGRRQYAVASRTRSAPVSGNFAPSGRYLLGTRHYSFISSVASGISQRPKVLLDVDCSHLLTGGTEQYENFSSTCWLEDHLHHFGAVADLSAQPSTTSLHCEVEEVELEACELEDLEALRDSMEVEESGNEPSGSSEGQSEDVAADDYGDGGGGGDGDGESNRPAGRNVNIFTRRRHLRRELAALEPPPYLNDPPPTYEEAVAGSSVLDIGNADYMW